MKTEGTESTVDCHYFAINLPTKLINVMGRNKSRIWLISISVPGWCTVGMSIRGDVTYRWCYLRNTFTTVQPLPLLYDQIKHISLYLIVISINTVYLPCFGYKRFLAFFILFLSKIIVIPNWVIFPIQVICRSWKCKIIHNELLREETQVKWGMGLSWVLSATLFLVV